MSNEKTHLENGKVVMSENEKGGELKFLISKDKVLQQLRECAENVKEEVKATINIPDNCFHLDPGTYSGVDLGALIYFIADMLE